jgi:hypothetical protein
MGVSGSTSFRSWTTEDPVRSPDNSAPPIDSSVAHPARRYDYLLGGKDNFAADREAAEKLIEIAPTARVGALENRWFLHRAVRFLAGQQGIRQFWTSAPVSRLPRTHTRSHKASTRAPEWSMSTMIHSCSSMPVHC